MMASVTSYMMLILYFFALLQLLQLGMLSTVRPDGSLVSHTIYTHIRHDQGSLWLFSKIMSHTMDELKLNNNVCVVFVKQNTGEWVSVSGKAEVMIDNPMMQTSFSNDIKVNGRGHDIKAT